MRATPIAHSPLRDYLITNRTSNAFAETLGVGGPAVTMSHDVLRVALRAGLQIDRTRVK
jgi:hypothetical protein